MEFVGVAPGESELVAFPYEFRTATGVMVRLHDMQLLELAYLAARAELTVRFVYDDPVHTPPEAVGTPVAVFRFEDAVVQQWEDLDDPGPDPNRVVQAVYSERTNLVQLVTGRTNLVVAARRMSVSMEPLG